MAFDWSRERVVVTGGAGFLGSYVVESLRRRGAVEVACPRSRDYDLVRMERVEALYRDLRPTIVLHLAARVGGIGANRENPGKFFYDNLMMGIQLLEEGRQVGLPRAGGARHHLRLPEVTPGAVQGGATSGTATRRRPTPPTASPRRCCWCRAPGLPPAVRLQLDRALPGQPLRPAGQLRPRSPRTSSRRSSASASRPGSAATGAWWSGAPGPPPASSSTSRTPPRAILDAAERYDGSEPVNLGTGKEISIRDLVATIARPCRLPGRDRLGLEPSPTASRAAGSTPPGPWSGSAGRPRTPFEAGLRETIEWFEANRGSIP